MGVNPGELDEEFEELVAHDVLTLLAPAAVDEAVVAIQAAEGSHHFAVPRHEGFPVRLIVAEDFHISVER